jgi:hypothetical protein
MATTIGINFRATSGYVTDGANETYCLLNDTYPVTRGGVTFGWDNLSGVGGGAVDRNNALDRRLAGINYLSNGGVNQPFRLDLATSGSYNVRIAVGDAGGANTQYVTVQDDTTTFITISGVATTTEHFVDASGVTRTSAADWVSNNVAVTRTFSSTILRVNIAFTSASQATTLAHVSVAPATPAGGFLNRNYWWDNL